MIGHGPHTVDREGTSFNFKPVSSLNILDSAVVTREGEELLPELEAGQLGPHVVLASRKHKKTLAVALNDIFCFAFGSRYFSQTIILIMQK